MSDTTHEAPERIWAWGWRDSSGWQEQTWQHEDEPMSTMEYVRADLVEAAEQRGYASAMEAERKLHEDRIAALTEQLAAARGDAEEAEAYAGWLEAKLAKAVAGMTALTDVSTLMQSSASHNRFRHNTIVTDSIWSQWSTQLKFARTTLTEMKG